MDARFSILMPPTRILSVLASALVRPNLARKALGNGKRRRRTLPVGELPRTQSVVLDFCMDRWRSRFSRAILCKRYMNCRVRSRPSTTESSRTDAVAREMRPVYLHFVCAVDLLRHFVLHAFSTWLIITSQSLVRRSQVRIVSSRSPTFL